MLLYDTQIAHDLLLRNVENFDNNLRMVPCSIVIKTGGGDYADDLLSDAQLSDSIFLDINKFPDA